MQVPFEPSIASLQQAMTARDLRSVDLVDHYCDRITSVDSQLHSVLQVNPAARELAAELDRERERTGPRGPLHGIPVLLKDNIDTADAMETTAGSLALLGSRPSADAFVAARLRAAGAVLLGKTNLSEWANFRSRESSSGWSARGGQCRNPYALDRTPCGSSSGSGVAVAADLAPVAVGTETDGSIVCPAAMCSLVGIKPTVGVTSRAGVIPISHTQDTIGPMARSVADAAALLGCMAGVDERDPATAVAAGRVPSDYTRFLDEGGLRGARIGVAREPYFGTNQAVAAAIEAAVDVMRRLGAEIVDPADIPTANAINDSDAEITLLLHEFKADLNAYLAGRPDTRVRTLADIIAFNDEHAEEELKYFGQDLFLMAEEKGPLTEAGYLEARDTCRRLARTEGLDPVMSDHRLDALVMPTESIPWCIDLENGDKPDGHGSSSPAAMAGYPAITLPAGYDGDLPIGITLTGPAFSEPDLIRFAYALEQAMSARRPPTLPA
jgi:amidase